MLELCLREAFVVVDDTIADELHLGLAGDGLEIWMENGLLRALRLVVPMSVTLGSGIEGLTQSKKLDVDIDTAWLGIITLVNLYCCSGDRLTSRKSNALC